MADINGNEVSWKKLWQLVSGIHYDTPNNTVLAKLKEVSRELQNGVLSQPTAKTVAKEIKDKPTLQQFSDNVQQYLGITAIQSSNLICSYLQHEYKGTGTSLINCLSTEQQKQHLLIDIAKYYSLERIILLKVIRNVLELHSSKVHPYASEYNTILQEINVATLRKSYIEQLRSLIKSTPPVHHSASDYYHSSNKMISWSEHCTREIIEVLQIILLTIEVDGIQPTELSCLVELFRSHSFGKQQAYLDSGNAMHVDLVARITYSEVAVFLKSVDASCKRMRSPDFVNDTVRLLDKQLVGLHQNAEHGPMLLAWMLFNMQNLTGESEDDELTLRHRQFGTRATHLDVFGYLHQMISHIMFKDLSTVARIVRRTIYNHMTRLCDLFDADGSVAQHAKVYELLSELLRTPGLAKDFCNRDDSGVRSLYNTSLENFPIDFSSLTMIADAVASTGAAHQSYIRKQLEQLPVYAEHYKQDNNLQLKQLTDSEFLLLQNYSPFQKIDFVIPAGTSVVLKDSQSYTTVHFRTPLNYFNVLHNEINELLVETQRYTEIGEERNRRVCDGLKYLAVAVRAVRDPHLEISNEMVHPTEMVFDVLSKLKVMQSPPIALLAKCLDVCGSLLPLFEDEIFQRVINLNILPFVANEQLDYKAYCNGVSFESGLVGYFLINFEKNSGRYDFLLTYLEFLKTYTKLSRTNTAAIELPGLVFMLREIFPHVHAWRFEVENDRQKIYTSVMQYFLDVLQTPNGNEHRLLLRDACVYSLLNLDNGMTLLRFVAIGNDQLQSIMQNVSNWMTASETGFNLLVQLSMTILMQILRLRKHDVSNKQELSPLESIIYTQPKQRDNLRIIPVVTSYMSNIFNRRLPLLSCRLLRRFAIEFQMSLLACLDMEPDQIRLTFLQRLPDDQESDQLKIAVIEFVEACINKQPGLTEAFFKIKNERRYLEKTPKTKDIGDGILTYMTQYLETISCDSNRIVSPLLSKIMSLFHALWKNNMQSLVQDLTATATFWPSLFNPLYGPIKDDIQAYSQLFNILGIELFRSTNENPMDTNLKNAFDKFFVVKNFEKWVLNIFNIPKETASQHVHDETPEWLCRLQSFKDFFVLLLSKSKHHGITIPDDSKKFIADQCLLTLVDRSNYMEDFRPFVILSELYVILLLSFERKYTRTVEEDDEMLKQITTLLNQTAISYREMHNRSRESVLAIALHSVELLSQELCCNPSLAKSFLRSTVSILCWELTEAECHIAQNITSDGHMSTVLSLNLLKKIALNYSSQSLSSNWNAEIIAHKIVNRLLSCLQSALHLHAFRKIVVEMLDVLIVLAQGICAAELLHCDIGNYLWMKLLPPKDLLQVLVPTTSANERAIPVSVTERWKANDWWPVYARGIQLVTVLMQAHDHLFLREALLFVGVHEEYIMDSILLAKVAMDADAMMLIKASLLFVAEMVQYEKLWRLDHSQSLISLMRSVQTMLDHAVSLLYRPRILKLLIEGNPTPQIELIYQDGQTLSPTDDLISAMNDLITVVTICSKCLLVFSPKLLDLLVETQFVPSQWQPLVEIQFGAPKLNVVGAVPQLTFGTILMAIAIFTKSLNLQNYSFHDVPLNRIHSVAANDTIDGLDSLAGPSESLVTRSLASPASATRNLFAKSLSMTSSTSNVTTAPSNEILSNLDERLCISGLEFVLTLLGTQSLLALKDPNMSTREKQLIKRELGTELAVYHDFIRRRLQSDTKGPLYRRKRGIAFLRSPTSDQNDNDNDDDDDNDNAPQQPLSNTERISSSSRQQQSMRVNVIRKLHAQHAKQQPTASIPTSQQQGLKRPPIDISPIGSASSTPHKVSSLPSSTPFDSGSRVILNPHSKRVTFSEDANKAKVSSAENTNRTYSSTRQDESNEDDTAGGGNEIYTGLSTVQLFESDYLHFMSNLFAYICQNE